MVFLDKLVVLRVHVSFQMFSRGYRGSLFDSCLRQKRLGGVSVETTTKTTSMQEMNSIDLLL